ncbi:MAG: NAD(P)/FAD-dependent oxidoreductase [Candidatus Omnitrophica bacterium]|nr:NAD(P)/FAD-dependent oxidoreductase [Candidatus Omnitrophota bacterium]
MHEVAIIGAGAAGIACAKEALKRGLKTLLIEESKESLGGTCINRGCIPTKFFLKYSHTSGTWLDSFKGSQEIIKKIKAPIIPFLEKQGLNFLWGKARFLGKNSLDVAGVSVKAKNIIIATGSSPRTIINNSKVIFADDLFSKDIIGDKILIIGAGYIGLEVASILSNFGKDIKLIEKEDRILSSFDSYLAARLRVILERKGIKIEIDRNIKDYNLGDFDLIISAVGRVPNLESLDIEALRLAKNPGGWIRTDSFLRTSLKGVYACGDVTGKKLLAYVAEYQAQLCINNISGKKQREDYKGLGECVFSSPAVAKVGILEDEAKNKGIKYEVVKSNFMKFSSSYVYGDADGFIKIIIDKRKRIIGAGIISQAAGELINILSLCIKNNLTVNDLRKCAFIHPTLSEIIPQLLNF